MSLKKALTDGSIAMPQPQPLDPEPLVDPRKLVVTRYGQETLVTHLSVEYLARQFAGTFFELNRSKRFRSIWGTSDKKQDYYVDKNWPYFIRSAKEVMASMLTSSVVSQDAKDEIYSALCQENTVGQLIEQESGNMQVARDDEHFMGDKALNREVDGYEN